MVQYRHLPLNKPLSGHINSRGRGLGVDDRNSVKSDSRRVMKVANLAASVSYLRSEWNVPPSLFLGFLSQKFSLPLPIPISSKKAASATLESRK